MDDLNAQFIEVDVGKYDPNARRNHIFTFFAGILAKKCIVWVEKQQVF